MSMNNYILNLLNIEDKNISILPNIKDKIIKNKKYKIIEGVLTYFLIFVLVAVVLMNHIMT